MTPRDDYVCDLYYTYIHIIGYHYAIHIHLDLDAWYSYYDRYKMITQLIIL